MYPSATISSALRIDAGTSGTTDGVVAEDDELDIEERTFANATNDRRHAVGDIAVERRLRTVGLIADDDRGIRRGVEAEFLRTTTECTQHLDQPRRADALLPSFRLTVSV